MKRIAVCELIVLILVSAPAFAQSAAPLNQPLRPPIAALRMGGRFSVQSGAGATQGSGTTQGSTHHLVRNVLVGAVLGAAGGIVLGLTTRLFNHDCDDVFCVVKVGAEIGSPVGAVIGLSASF